MRKISPKVKAKLEQEPDICLRRDEGDCKGRITWEHALTYGSRQIDEAWAILKICEFHHAVNTYQDCGKMNKEKHIWLALNRATDDELDKYYKADFKSKRERLNKIYGTNPKR